MIRLLVGRTSRPTGRVLMRLLEREGIRISDAAEATVSYGVHLLSPQHPTLNANAGASDKLRQLQMLQAANVVVPRFFDSEHITLDAGFYPVLARKRQHVGGRDIMPAFSADEARWRIAAGAEFFTRYVPSSREFRVWVYRRRHLGTYEKVMAHPRMFRGIGRNYNNGFAFQLVTSESVPREATEIASTAVEALRLDFGAVDMLLGTDGRYYVLEVNTAPGVEGETRQAIQALAHKIAHWEQLHYPRRNGDIDHA